MLLRRNVQDDKPFVGFMKFVAQGVQKGKPVKIVLQPALVPGSSAASAAEQVKGVDLNFDQFQHGGGLLSIPEGFTPQAITLNIFEGSTLRVSRSEEHTSELQSLMRISYAVFCLKKKKQQTV